VAEGGSGDEAKIRYELSCATDDGSAVALPYSRIMPELEPGSSMTGELPSVNQETAEVDRFGGPRALIRGSGKASGAIRRDAARGDDMGSRSMWTLLVIQALIVTAAAPASPPRPEPVDAAGRHRLWRIGTVDGGGAEFALAPGATPASRTMGSSWSAGHRARLGHRHAAGGTAERAMS
jgi:hypothetical protein